MSDSGRRGRRQLGLLWAGSVLGLLAMAPFGELLAAGSPACPVKTWFGVPCPSCGATRAALLLAELRVGEALTRFPLPTLGWIAFIGGGLVAGAWVALGRDLPEPPRRLPAWAVVALVAMVAAGWTVAIVGGA